MSLGDKANAESATMRLGWESSSVVLPELVVCSVCHASNLLSDLKRSNLLRLQPFPVLQPHNTETCRWHPQEQRVQCCENHNNCNTAIHHCEDIGSSHASHPEPQGNTESSTCDGTCSESLSIVLLCFGTCKTLRK